MPACATACVHVFKRERETERASKRGSFDSPSPLWGLGFVCFVCFVFFVFLLCFFFLFWESVYVLASVRVTSPCWLTDCCSAF